MANCMADPMRAALSLRSAAPPIGGGRRTSPCSKFFFSINWLAIRSRPLRDAGTAEASSARREDGADARKAPIRDCYAVWRERGENKIAHASPLSHDFAYKGRAGSCPAFFVSGNVDDKEYGGA